MCASSFINQVVCHRSSPASFFSPLFFKKILIIIALCTFWVLIIHLECSILTVSFFILFCNTGLSYDTNEPILRDAFGQHGEIIEGKIKDPFLLFWVPIWSCNYVAVATISFFFSFAVKVICDHVTGKSRGYGFVRFVSETIAAATHKEMNGQVFNFFSSHFYLIWIYYYISLSLKIGRFTG